jgi:hypothetical protein
MSKAKEDSAGPTTDMSVVEADLGYSLIC